jgi:hypothetical protein
MKRLMFASLLALAASICVSDTVQAQGGSGVGYPFFPYGFYQPYGARYGSSISTPPYFALNPPVYYGARYARPYGSSPFASPPVVAAPGGYQGRPRTPFHEPLRPTPAPICNPCLSKSSSLPVHVAEVGKVRLNPFVDTADKVAKN